MKLFCKLASTIFILQINLGVLANTPDVEVLQAAEEIEPTADQTSQDATASVAKVPKELNEENFYQLVVDKTTDQVSSDKPWFIKFFAPWCGHCKRLAPTWEELSTKNGSKLNVGTVDCTSDLGRPLCNHYEVRGYPTLLYFPISENSDKPSQYYKYQGPRSLDYLESFALNGGYLEAEQEEIPKNLEGFAYWQRYAQRAAKDAAREIDMLAVQYGMDKMLPPVARYLLALSVVVLPVVMLFVMICCCTEEYDEEAIRKQAM